MLQQEETVLDVTVIEPRQKHATIFQYFDALEPGESFVISNDHDPKPLYYQFLGERGQVFSWEYLEEGPQTWKVRIGKLDQEQKETLGELAAKDLRKAEVFKKYGLDFCCGGSKTLDEACEDKQIDKEALQQELKATDEAQPQFIRFNEWAPTFLADFIVHNHHKYVKERIPEIQKYLNKIAKVHGRNHPELHEVESTFANIAADLTDHMQKEEMILFPYIHQLQEALDEGQKPRSPEFGTVSNPIQMMEQEHQEAGETMETIRKQTSDFQLPEDACASYQLSFQMLEEFEGDLQQHIHLENNLLFPQAKEMEKKAFQ